MQRIKQFRYLGLIPFLVFLLFCHSLVLAKTLKNNSLSHFAPPTGTIRIDHHTLVSHNAPRYCFNNNGVLLSSQPENRLLSIPITQEMGGEELTVKGVADSNACLTSHVRFVISNIKAVGCNATLPTTVSVSDSRFQLRDTVWSATVRFNWQGEEQFFTVKLTDGCGNVTTQKVKMIFEDNAPPKAITNPSSFDVFRGDTVLLRVTDIASNSTDNCGIKSMMLRLSNAPADDCWSSTLKLKHTNPYTTTYKVVVRILDNNNMVSDRQTDVYLLSQGSFSISGSVFNNNRVAIDKVTINLINNNRLIDIGSTPADGGFILRRPIIFDSLIINAAKTDTSDVREGLSTSDLSMISRHILGTNTLGTYAIIAADIDRNQSVDALDMLHLRKYLLHLSPKLPSTHFRFVSEKYVFPNPKDPFETPFEESIIVRNTPTSNDFTPNFIAIKIGDVNYTYRHVSQRSSRVLTLTTDDFNVEAGKTYTFTIKAAQFDAAAFQGTLACKGLIVKGFQVGNLKNMTEANFGKFSDALTMSWNGSITEGGYDLVTVTVLAQNSGKLSQFLSFGSALTPAEAVAENGEGRTIALTFNTDKLVDKTISDQFVVHQNAPNPVSTNTRIGFYLPTNAAADLTIFNAAGQVILRKNGQFLAGQNQFLVQKSELTTGVLFYQVAAEGQKMVRKMVVLD